MDTSRTGNVYALWLVIGLKRDRRLKRSAVYVYRVTLATVIALDDALLERYSVWQGAFKSRLYTRDPQDTFFEGLKPRPGAIPNLSESE